jgi:hypothetical protein
MNLAFQAFFLVLLYLPGALFWSGFWGKLSKEQELPVLSLSLTGRAAAALIAALLLNAAWIVVGHMAAWGGWNPTPSDVLVLLAGQAKDNAIYQGALDRVGAHLDGLFLYFITLYVASWALGWAIHRNIRDRKLDRKFPLLRFSNRWHYILSGEIVDFPEFKTSAGAQGISGEGVFVYLDALVEIDKKPYLYTGIVADWWFDNAGNLEIVALRGVTRTTFEAADKNPPGEPAEIPGDYIYLKYEEIQNANLTYFNKNDLLREVTPEDSPVNPQVS